MRAIHTQLRNVAKAKRTRIDVTYLYSSIMRWRERVYTKCMKSEISLIDINFVTNNFVCNPSGNCNAEIITRVYLSHIIVSDIML